MIVSPLRQCKTDLGYPYEEIKDFNEEASPITTLPPTDKTHQKLQSATTNESKRKSKEIELPDISLWGDFNKLSLYLREVHLYYRPKFFEYFIEISDSFPNHGKKSKSTITSGLGPERFYEYQDKVSPSRNEPLYLFIDSLDEKFFLINLSIFNNESCAMIVERYDWFENRILNTTVAEIRTRGTKSTVLQLEAGRHLLRIFLNGESNYHMTILSDTSFQIGDRMKMHELMTTECHRVNVIGQKINNCLKKAFESFGTSSYLTNLKLFYRSYMPESSAANLNIKVLKSIHCSFLNELINLLNQRFTSGEFALVKHALSVFFLDPTILMETTDPLRHTEENESRKSVQELDAIENKSATIIQSFFRMALVRRYKEIHEPAHQDHSRVKEALARIIDLFNYDKRKYAAQILLRAIIKRDDNLKSVYPYANDLKNVINVQELKGIVTSVLPDQWTPIVRVVVNVRKWETVLASVDLFTKLNTVVVRVFDNDTKREMPRQVNNVRPETYRYREGGYTIFAYGWSDFQRSVQRYNLLRFVKVKLF